MFLLIPTVYLESGKCRHRADPKSNVQSYSSDPIKALQLWRLENTKLLNLHIIARSEKECRQSLKTLEELVSAVDIPLQISSDYWDAEMVDYCLKMGSCRLVIPQVFISDFYNLIKTSGSLKYAIEVNVEKEINWEEVFERINKTGINRLVVAGSDYQHLTRSISDSYLDQMKSLALKLTARVGFSSYQDLIQIASENRLPLDSAIIGWELYQNEFACQELWRMNEQQIDIEAEIRKYTHHKFGEE